MDSLVDEDCEYGRQYKPHSRLKMLSSDSDQRTNNGSRSPEFQTRARFGSRSPEISSRNNKYSSRSPQIGSRTLRTGSVNPVKIRDRKRSFFVEYAAKSEWTEARNGCQNHTQKGGRVPMEK